MKTHKLPAIGMSIGLGILICSVIRWFFMFYDPSQMIFGISTGATISIFSYIYNWMRENDLGRIKLNKRLDDFTEWWTKQELK